jgi:hypothetical protein
MLEEPALIAAEKAERERLEVEIRERGMTEMQQFTGSSWRFK